MTSTDDEHDPEGTTIAFERAQVRSLLDQAKTDRAALQDATARLATTPTAYARTARNASASSACWSSPGPHAASPVPTPE